MATITTLLTTLVDEMKDKINTANDAYPYRTDPNEIYQGLKALTDVRAFPVICCELGEEELTEYFGDSGHGIARIIVYGYSETDNVDNRNTIRDLAHDALYFLFNSYTYASDIMNFSSIEYFPGTAGRPAGFLFDFEVKYEFTNTNI